MKFDACVWCEEEGVATIERGFVVVSDDLDRNATETIIPAPLNADDLYLIECKECKASTRSYETLEEAHKNWNEGNLWGYDY